MQSLFRFVTTTKRPRIFKHTLAKHKSLRPLSTRFSFESRHRPIGVFDSGVGGLSVLREIRRELPFEDLIYVADSAHAPYGDKPREQIESRSFAIAEFLLTLGAKAIVVACNTATSAAAVQMRQRLSVPLIAMEPAVKPAVVQTRSGVVGVLATSQTLASHSFVNLLGQYAIGADVLVQPCPGLVERVEQGALECDITRRLVTSYVKPLLDRGADTLVLGCTHYPHLRPLIQEVAGPEVSVLDSGVGVARQVRRRLGNEGLLRDQTSTGYTRFFASGDLARTAVVIEQIWADATEVHPLPDPATKNEGKGSHRWPLTVSKTD